MPQGPIDSPIYGPSGPIQFQQSRRIDSPIYGPSGPIQFQQSLGYPNKSFYIMGLVVGLDIDHFDYHHEKNCYLPI